MTENLKRAESLFNRIMNQNNNASTSTSTLSSSASTSSSSSTYPNNKHSYNSNGSSSNSNSGKKRNSKDHHHHHHHYHNFHNPHHHHHHYNQVVNVDLPRRDPIQVAKETLSHVPQESHVLPYCWTIWHHSRNKLKVEELEEDPAATAEGANGVTEGSGQASTTSAPTVDSYLQTTKEIAFVNIHAGAEAEVAPLDTTSSIGTVEQMWMSLSTLKPAFQLRYGTELLIFKSGINPVWEDPVNAKGGRWVFRFSRRGQNSSGGNNSNSRNGNGDDNESIMRVRKRSSLIWERLVLRVLTGSIIPEGDYLEEIQDLLLNDISGVVLSVRRDEDIISVWNSNLNFNKKGSVSTKEGDNGSKKLTLFQARRIICDSILRVIRECDLISQGSDCIETIDSGSNERVFGVSFEYRLHADNNTLPGVTGDNGASGNGTSGNGKYGGERGGRKYNNKLYHHKKEGHNSFAQSTVSGAIAE